MRFPRAAAATRDLVVVPEVASTNDLLLALASGTLAVGSGSASAVAAGVAVPAPEFTVILTTNQTSGRGRLGREWIAPAGQGLAASVLLRPRLASGKQLAVDHYGWLPLLAGLAMTRSVSALVPESVGSPPAAVAPSRVTLKWPNDVLIEGQKVCGLLAELLPSADGVVIGCGVNLTIPADALPTPVSTSLSLHGVELEGDALVDAVLGGFLEALRDLYTVFLGADADASACGLRDAVSERCSSLGQQVRVELPGGDTLLGLAVGLDESGRLLVRRASDDVRGISDDAVQAVAAGDVTHLRYE
jgi:BirA family biotin operon repressor/biotin-[acetyl-CoA-carboxylase] ligase